MSNAAQIWQLVLAALSGAAFGLAAPPSPLHGLAWLGFAPLLLALDADVTPRRAALLGFVAGLPVSLVGFPWISQLLVNFAGFPGWLGAVALFVFASWQAVPYALFALGVAWGPRRGAVAWLLVLALFPALMSLWPVLFAYTPLIGITTYAPWIQLAELGGVHLVEATVLLANLLVVRAVRVPELRARLLAGGLAVGLHLLVTAGGHLRLAQLDADTAGARRIAFGLVQPNLPVLFDDSNEAMQRLRGESARAQQLGAQVIVWPEAGTYPFLLERPLEREPQEPRARVLLEHSAPTLFGAVTVEPGQRFPYNTFYNLASDGSVRDHFDKVELVPFGESIPLVDPGWAQRVIPNMGHLNPGQGPRRFTVDPLGETTPVHVGPLICMEDIIAEFARETAATPGGIEVFVNATIDDWYGGGSEPWEHLALAKFRSVEHRIPLLRSVSTGVTSVVDQGGRLVAHIPPRRPQGGRLAPPEQLVHGVVLARNTADAPTPFARFGHWFPQLCQLAALLILLDHARQRRAG